MAKDKEKKKKKKSKGNHSLVTNERVPKDVVKFVKMNFKSFKKANKDFFEGCEGKKEKKKAIKRLRTRYIDDLIEYFPASIEYVICNAGSNDKNIQDIVEAIKEKIYDEHFVSYLIELIETDVKIDNMELLPVVYRFLLIQAHKMAEESKETGENNEYDNDDVLKLIKLIIKKKYKKLVSRGVPEKQAFDLCTILPTVKVFKHNYLYRHFINTLLTCMYDYARDSEVRFNEIISVLLKTKDEDNDDNEDARNGMLASVVTQILLEKKAIIADFTETQKSLYNQITRWALTTLEKIGSREKIEDTLRTYIRIRRNDERKHRDGNRRIYLSTISADDYPKIASVVKILSENTEFKKYL